ncbi:2-amino-4-hydroxy-6-hydroxymethyldihydropteridinediphosphokinase [soil metagenome]
MIDGVFLLLGTNLGDRKQNLETARLFLKSSFIKIKSLSSLYESEPWGIARQPAFYNQAIEILTQLSPEKLLIFLKNIEQDMGRVQNERWKERIIDIDILYYQDKINDDPFLKIPHPEIPNRKFTLMPLNEIAPDFIHPILKLNQRELLELCDDPLEVNKI